MPVFTKPVRRKVDAPGGVITPVPDYCWGQFATNGRGNRNTNGPTLDLTGGNLVGENLEGVAESSGLVGDQEDHIWIYVRLFLPNAMFHPGATQETGFAAKMRASSVDGMYTNIRKTTGVNGWYYRQRVWDRKSYEASYVLYPMSTAPGSPGHQEHVMILDQNNITDQVKTLYSDNGSSWLEIRDEIVAGVNPFVGLYPLYFNTHTRNFTSTDPPASQLVECCFREGGGYTDQENLTILQNGMEAAFGL